MSLSIILLKQRDRLWYTSLDDICGRLVFTNKNSINVSRIVVYLEGILKTSIRPINANQDHAFGNSEHVLFSREAVVFCSQSTTSGRPCNTFGPGTHPFPFNLEVPLLTSCSTTRLSCVGHTQSALPPSFELTSDTLKASATYRLRAVVERPGLLKRKLVVVQSVEFRPLQPPRLTEHFRHLRITGHLKGESLGAPGPDPTAGSDVLPSYSPSVVLEVTIPSSKTIRPGDRLDLSVKLSIPAELRQPPDLIWLESLTIRLRTKTTGSVAHYNRSHISYINICTAQGFLPLGAALEGERCTIPKELWTSHIYPPILPSFRSCGIQRAHRLEVLVGIVSRLTDNVHTVAASADVVVESGVKASSELPPDYNE